MRKGAGTPGKTNSRFVLGITGGALELGAPGACKGCPPQWQGEFAARIQCLRTQMRLPPQRHASYGEASWFRPGGLICDWWAAVNIHVLAPDIYRTLVPQAPSPHSYYTSVAQVALAIKAPRTGFRRRHNELGSKSKLSSLWRRRIFKDPVAVPPERSNASESLFLGLAIAR